MENTYRIPDENLGTLRERIGKLAKRAQKLGVEIPTLRILRQEEVIRWFDGGAYFETEEAAARYTSHPIRVVQIFHHIEVSGPAPKIAGWTFAAVLQATVDESGAFVGNVLRIVPGFEQAIPEQYRSATSKCDHCQTARRRNETFVLVNESGEWKQVGRRCLRDFLGHTSPEAYAEWAQVLMDIDDLCHDSEGYEGPRTVRRFPADDILTLAATIIRLYGFRSNKTAKEFGGESTSQAISSWIFGTAASRDQWDPKPIPTDADKKQAADVYAWLQTLGERSDLNDYMYNLSIVGKGAIVESRNFGLVVSAIPTWAREQEREINRRKRFEEDNKSQYVGIVGERSTFADLTLVYTQDFEFESNFGPARVTHLYKFKDANGNIVVYFASNVMWNENRKQDIEVGDTVMLVARVKKQEVRNDVKQTVITRASFPKVKVPKASKALMKTIAWG